MTQASPKQIAARPLVRGWLYFVAVLIFAMVIVGGATRLTDSGLSITQWKPLLGAIPPLGEADWADAFARYKQIPEYEIVNKGMSLAEFKVIYWWEWGHRFLGRFIGVAFFVPFLFFALTGRLERALWPRLAGIFILGALQGGLGWYMVMSGLTERVDVSQYRLAAHLTFACVIYAAIIWTALGIGRKRRWPRPGAAAWVSLALVVAVFGQIAAGGFVAGLDAGQAYATWPEINDAIIAPSGLGELSPWWRNLFDNRLTVQYDHRMIGYAIGVLVVIMAWYSLRREAGRARMAMVLLVLAVAGQITLGIATLLTGVRIDVALAHQGGALMVLALALWRVHALMTSHHSTSPRVSAAS